MMFFRALALLLALGGSALAQSGQIPSATVWGNSGASKAIASPATLSAMFDRAFGSTGGSLIARSGAAWGLVSGTATARLPLLSGANTTPVWGAYTLPASVTSGGVSCFTSTSAAGSSVLLTASALVLGGGAGACPSPMASLGTTTTLLHGNAAGAPTFGAVVAADVTTNTLTNATLAQAAASTLKGNPTAGSANVQDFTITALTSKATPAAADELLLSDSAASNAFKKATVTSLLAAGAVTSINGQAGALTMPVLPQGRLTLQTLTPVMITTQSAKTTIYYTAYQGNQIPIYDGTNMISTPITGGEISVLTTDTTKSAAAIGASKVNDWFVWNDAGTIRVGHGPDWTSDTARSAGTALVMVNGIYLNNASITNGPAASRGTYVGTTRSNASSQLDWILGSSAGGGGMASLYVWNAYNQVKVATSVIDSVASWTYSTATVRGLDNSSSNRVNFVSGLQLHGIIAQVGVMVRAPAVSGSFGEIGITIDSTTTISAGTGMIGRAHNNAAVILDSQVNVSMNYAPQLGAHFIQATETGDGTNTATFFGGLRESFSFSTMM